MVCTPQVIDLETEQGHPHVHFESFNRTGNDSSDQGMNHPHQFIHNLPPNLAVDSELWISFKPNCYWKYG
ncbi:hypothetical protein GUJ93_ZPchr0001g29652 [Zizania palustris]|uniref:Uncharacterized protein n=1 Tax=Zizania palustris TaxID=103762 RepID=A0A8J5SE53_ZIZPA|nr:hypothetical protein GUJ93_ZPchr0001g29652 [Zizania palustris]